jgi:phospholipid-transporting ATPase
LKDFFEDHKRKVSDDQENRRKCLVLNPETRTFEERTWQEVQVGHIIKVKNNESFPADIILLNSSEENGLCYVETKNLDGETSLKYKGANGKIVELFPSETDLADIKGIVECKKPNEYIFEFNGNMILNDSSETIAIDKNSFLLRGCSLKQTEYIYGLSVYVGHNTKIMINSPNARHKISKIEYIMNYQIIIIFILDLVLSLTGAIAYILLINSDEEKLDSYLHIKNDKTWFVTMLSRLGTWILIFTNLVPISLLVTMEMVKYIQGMFIAWDAQLYDEEKHTPTRVQTSTLNEELGQVKVIENLPIVYIFR